MKYQSWQFIAKRSAIYHMMSAFSPYYFPSSREEHHQERATNNYIDQTHIHACELVLLLRLWLLVPILIVSPSYAGPSTMPP